ncbi:Peptidase U32 [gamma proteobacterium HdN1]|nr:Peptidase U32 [gamma proteobacterium HdN1]
MRFAFAYGADAVYAGQPRYSLRVRNNEFNHIENIASAIEEAHSQGKKFYLASNVSPHNDKIRSYLKDMAPIVAMKPDALIMSDPGLIMMVRETWPNLEIHLSVQANAINWPTVKFWHRQGLSRVILSRELSLEEIGEIREHVPGMEIEVFVHGALCMAYSGRCLLSGYMNHRDPNQGACTNTCRWKYQAHEAQETVDGDIIAQAPIETATQQWQPETQTGPTTEPPVSERIFLLQEEGRPGEYMPAYEDEHGTYIMNSKDLRAIQHVQKLVQMGVHSLKIEGRTKSHFYVARTAQIYRQAINDALQGREFNMDLMLALDGLANRGYTEGFYRRHVPEEYQNYQQGTSSNATQQFVGEVSDYDASTGLATIVVKNRFAVGDSLELMRPEGNYRFQLEAMTDKKKGTSIHVAPGDGHIVQIPLPAPVSGDFNLLMRDKIVG